MPESGMSGPGSSARGSPGIAPAGLGSPELAAPRLTPVRSRPRSSRGAPGRASARRQGAGCARGRAGPGRVRPRRDRRLQRLREAHPHPGPTTAARETARIAGAANSSPARIPSSPRDCSPARPQPGTQQNKRTRRGRTLRNARSSAQPRGDRALKAEKSRGFSVSVPSSNAGPHAIPNARTAPSGAVPHGVRLRPEAALRAGLRRPRSSRGGRSPEPLLSAPPLRSGNRERCLAAAISKLKQNTSKQKDLSCK